MIEVRKILNAVRKDVAAKESRKIVEISDFTVGAKTVEKPMVALHEDSLFSKLGVKVLPKLVYNTSYPYIVPQNTIKVGELEDPDPSNFNNHAMGVLL